MGRHLISFNEKDARTALCDDCLNNIGHNKGRLVMALLVFCTETYGSPSKENIREIIYCIESFSMHCLRHTFATRCIEAGMKPKTLQKILGHSTLGMTMDLYVHVTDDTVFDEMEKFSRCVNVESEAI